METYSLRRVGDETARTVARCVGNAFEVNTVRVRGLAEVARAGGDVDIVPDGETGYFEREMDGDEIGPVIDALPSLTRVVFYADTPVFAWFDDGKVYLRAEDPVLEDLRDDGIEPTEASGTPDSVVAEMDEDG